MPGSAVLGTQVGLLVVLLVALLGCSAAPSDPASAPAGPESEDPAAAGTETDPDDEVHDHRAHDHDTFVPRARPLRAGEQRRTLRMPEAYTPSAPTGVGTDDYRCFLLDPELKRDRWITGTHVLPGNRDVVHHVILFRVPPAKVAAAEARDDAEQGPGWTCFGGTGVDQVTDVDDAGWLGAWAPGGRESLLRPGLGVPLEAGSRVVMQVHYNLLAGDSPDVSATQLRLAGPGAEVTGVGTMLLPAPVELPCRRGRDDSKLCGRDAALADNKARFGQAAGATADLLHLLCGSRPTPGNTQSCTRTVSRPTTIHGVAGHMHLLGRSIRVEVNPGTERARTVLDIPVWDFDNQAAKPVEPVRLEPFDEVRVTCRHVQWLRDELPALAGQEERYVLWGEGTTDEMCLGILQVTHP